MGRHADTDAGRADDWATCSGENREDPDSWDDPAIVDQPWELPAVPGGDC